jgi:hypothetical protein
LPTRAGAQFANTGPDGQQFHNIDRLGWAGNHRFYIFHRDRQEIKLLFDPPQQIIDVLEI